MNGSVYSTHEASKLCNVYPTTIIKWIEEGLLPAFTTPGGHRRIKKSDLVELMNKNNMPLPDELVRSEKKRVLVIDDDVKIARMIKTILEDEDDFEISLARHGFEAGVKVTEWIPDIILLDILMPDVDGYEVCRRIRQNQKLKDIPIIAVTILKDEKEIKKIKESGFSDYLPKPFKRQALVEKIREHLNRQHA